jgi:septal ring factor EnvC (AmiA/AmiB activator)
MSATLNASLAEMGHFPLSNQILQELRQQNTEFCHVNANLREHIVALQRVIEFQSQQLGELHKQIELHRHELHRLHGQLKQAAFERDNLARHARMYVPLCLHFT